MSPVLDSEVDWIATDLSSAIGRRNEEIFSEKTLNNTRHRTLVKLLISDISAREIG